MLAFYVGIIDVSWQLICKHEKSLLPGELHPHAALPPPVLCSSPSGINQGWSPCWVCDPCSGTRTGNSFPASKDGC
jgi:hypothetical protein